MDNELPKEQPQQFPPMYENNSFPEGSNNLLRIIIIGVVIFFLLIIIATFFLVRPSQNAKNTQTPKVTSTPSPKPIQETTKIDNKIIFIRDSNVWIKQDNQEKQITSDARYIHTDTNYYPVVFYSNPSLSPDGTKLVFFKSNIATESATTPTLYVSNVDGTNLKPLIENGPFERTYVVPWLDNQTILLETMTSATNSIHMVSKLNIQTKSKQNLVQYAVESGCGGGSPDPSIGLAGAEGARPLYAKIFALSYDKKYLMHNISCSGYGVGVYNLQTNQDRIISSAITQAVFSHDNSKIAGIDKANHIFIYDIASNSLGSILTLSIEPQVLYWSQDNKTIYYGAHTLMKPLTAKDPLENILEGSQNQASFWSITTDNKKNTKIHEFDAYDLKPILVNNNIAIISLVENPTKYFEAINNNNLANISAVLPTVNIVSLNIQSDATEDIIPNAFNAIYTNK